MDDYDTIPVDYQPDFGDAPIPKAGQQLPPQVTSGDVSGQAGELTKSILGNVTGLSDAYKAISGQMTPEEQQQMFVMALPGLIPGARAEEAVAKEVPTFARTIDAFHGSPIWGLKELVPGPRGPFGSAVYLSPTEDVAQRYAGVGGKTYPVQVQDEIFHGLGSNYLKSSDNPYEVWRGQTERLLNAADPKKRSAIEAASTKLFPNEGYGFFNEVSRILGSQDAAQDLFLKAGFSGISGHVDGPEIAMFNNVPIRNAEGSGQGGNLGTFNTQTAGTIQNNQPPPSIRAYHGSPYDFPAERLVQHPNGTTEYIQGRPDVLPDIPEGATVLRDFPLGRMRMDKIGTGEGAQAYGHGLYNAEAEPVAQEYRKRLADWPTTVRELTGMNLSDDAVNALLQGRAANPGNPTRAATVAQWRSPELRGVPLDKLSEAVSGVDQREHAGRMYEVSINADPEHFLDWDKPLSEQPEAVKNNPKFQEIIKNEAYNRALASTSKTRADQLWAMVKDPMTAPAGFAQDLLKKPETSQALRDAGIPGIKYLDQGSRGNTPFFVQAQGDKFNVQGPGNISHGTFDDRTAANEFADQKNAEGKTSNYVVFSDKIISILKKYGLAGLVAGNAAHFSTTPVDHDPFEDKGMAWGGAVSNKITKIEAKYRGGVADRRCALCDMFRKPSTCTAVKGKISPWAVCRLFERKK